MSMMLGFLVITKYEAESLWRAPKPLELVFYWRIALQ